MRKFKSVSASAVAGLMLSLGGWAQAQEAGDKADVYRDKDSTLQSDVNVNQQQRDQAQRPMRSQSGVTAVNKASSLIGIEVKNLENQSLGEIKDIVFDMPSGKISYVVLGVGGFLGVGEKLLAIPPSTFQTDPVDKKLILNADKAKIEGAPGFVRTNWPDPNAPVWGAETYWKTETKTGAGAAPAVESGQEKGRLDNERFRSERPFDSAEYNQERLTFKGKITAIDPDNKRMTVKSNVESREFTFEDRPRIVIAKNPNAKIVDLKVGYDVAVGYHKEGDQYVAHSVSRTDRP